MKKYIGFVIIFLTLAVINYVSGFEMAILAGLAGIFAQLESKD